MERKNILGAQGNLWSEYLDNEKKLEYMVFPRMSALAEVLWSPKVKRSWEDFERRLPKIIERYKFGEQITALLITIYNQQ